uniref:Uncharacterized protein n=1 Tax=Strombidinopsis acuminata TaxID=141414 RepID=A0A7S3X9N7_9SPIT|mmetsp:Transcript_88490/g.228168  ORF Transcript_88490/g.228168 Transcript_88490/m.228168 type:complete len:488 (-) Transcript_88490:231-1694(-)
MAACHSSDDSALEDTDTSQCTGSSDDDIKGKEQFRFDRKVMDEFNSSLEGKLINSSCFLFSLFYMWPYQTMVQTQNFLVEEFPERANTAGFVMMLSTTFPFVITHGLLSVTGLTNRCSYAVRMTVPPMLVVVLAMYLFCVLTTSEDQGLLLFSLYFTALVISTAEGICEPAVYEIAGLMPSTVPSMMVQSGNGACGLCVSCIQVLTRLFCAGLGPVSKEQLKALTKGFLVLMGLSNAAFLRLYWGSVRQTSPYKLFVMSHRAEDDDHSAEESDGASLAKNAETEQMSLVMATVLAIREIWPTFLSVVLTFFVTLTLWPVIPGRTCVGEEERDETLQSWWFDIIIFTFNLSDFLGKSEPKSLKWGARVLTPMQHLLLAVLRGLIFAPLILTGSAPQKYDSHTARWVVLLSVFTLGITNGWLSTVCFMRAPKAFPPSTPSLVARQASSGLVLGLFTGISGGCMGAFLLSQTTLISDSLGGCYGATATPV